MALRAEAASRRILDAFRHVRLPQPRTQPAADELMPLAEAARQLRSAQRDSDLDCMARGLSDNDENLLHFWAHRVAQAGVPVYGCRIMATTLVQVPAHDMLAGKLLNNATRLDSSRGHPARDICALQVKRSDFDACLTRQPSSV